VEDIVRMADTTADNKVNFRLLRPTLDHISYNASELQVRLEGPPIQLHPNPVSAIWSNWAGLLNHSVIFNLKTDFGKLRCKQYLYDLGPLSALDHAALFDNKPECIEAHRLDDVRIAWTGYDYGNKRTLSMLAWGTNLELREIEGHHTLGFLLKLARSFEPVGRPKSTPFANRSYWSRYPRYDIHMCRDRYYRPPSSLWLWRWPWIEADHHWQARLPELQLVSLQLNGNNVFTPEWRFDSACIFGETDAPAEVQLIFEPTSGIGHARLWLRQFPRSLSPIAEPSAGHWPPLDAFSGYEGFSRSEFNSESGLRICVASHHLEYGPHDAVWWQGNFGYLLQMSAAVRHNLQYLAATLVKVLAEPVHLSKEISLRHRQRVSYET
jgi:hypothetical protein